MIDVEATSGIEREYEIRNFSDVDPTVVQQAPEMRTLQRELALWSETVRTNTGRGTMFDRKAFTPPNNVYDEMRAARNALEVDDVVSGVADITEAFAFQGNKWESTNSDEADVFNQWSGKVNLDDFLRRMWREEYTISQVVVAAKWDYHEFTVRGKSQPDTETQTDDNLIHPSELPDQPVDAFTGKRPDPPKKPQGRKRRKTYKIWAPSQLTVLDATKVVPVAFSPIAPEQLAWCASKAEMGYWAEVEAGRIVDLEMQTFFLGQYVPGKAEEERLQKMGVPTDQLLLMNPELVWRHTLTKADYEAFPQLRMKSIFSMLDMKRQLMNADRAALIGAANYILLVKKGSDNMPAQQAELESLKENYNFIAKMPVIISDHRLEIEIVAPKVDMTLNGDKYDVMDSRILMRLLGTLSLGSKGQRNETNVTLSTAVAKMMDNRRHMMKRAIEERIARAICEHPKNKKPNNTQIIEDEPNLVFLPRQVSLGFDPAFLQAMMSLRTQREISRETILEQFGLDQSTEAMRVEHEADWYDDIFKTQIPFAAAGQGGPSGGATGNTGDPTQNGAQGGRPLGGGSPAANSKPTSKTANGNTKKGTA